MLLINEMMLMLLFIIFNIVIGLRISPFSQVSSNSFGMKTIAIAEFTSKIKQPSVVGHCNNRYRRKSFLEDSSKSTNVVTDDSYYNLRGEMYEDVGSYSTGNDSNININKFDALELNFNELRRGRDSSKETLDTIMAANKMGKNMMESFPTPRSKQESWR